MFEPDEIASVASADCCQCPLRAFILHEVKTIRMMSSESSEFGAVRITRVQSVPCELVLRLFMQASDAGSEHHHCRHAIINTEHKRA